MMTLTMAWRTAGNLGGGGGPAVLFSPARLCEACLLKQGVSDHGHARRSVKALPGSAREVVEAEFFFHLLVGLFANPSCLDDGSQSAQVRLGGEVGEIVFLLS